MDRQAAADAIVEHIRANDALLQKLKSPTPPPRPVELLRRSWEPWLFEGGRPGTSSYVGPIDAARITSVKDALKGLTPRDPARTGADLEIDRSHLVALATAASRSSPRRCVAVWVASMMWGSGTLNGRGPWRTAEGLAHVELAPILVESHRHLRAGEMAEAYEVASEIPGSGETSFTKWLWAASLGLPTTGVTALIVDQRVRSSLAAIGVRPNRTPAGYAEYVDAMALAAATLRERHGRKGATPEALEWVLSQEAE